MRQGHGGCQSAWRVQRLAPSASLVLAGRLVPSPDALVEAFPPAPQFAGVALACFEHSLAQVPGHQHGGGVWAERMKASPAQHALLRGQDRSQGVPPLFLQPRTLRRQERMLLHAHGQRTKDALQPMKVAAQPMRACARMRCLAQPSRQERETALRLY
jgi:hypothetical protein